MFLLKSRNQVKTQRVELLRVVQWHWLIRETHTRTAAASSACCRYSGLGRRSNSSATAADAELAFRWWHQLHRQCDGHRLLLSCSTDQMQRLVTIRCTHTWNACIEHFSQHKAHRPYVSFRFLVARDQLNSRFHGRDIFREIDLLPWKTLISMKSVIFREF